MKIVRKMEIDTDDIRIGDQIRIPIGDYVAYTATAQKLSDKGVFFLFDQIIDASTMVEKNDDNIMFARYNLEMMLIEVILPKFPEELQHKVAEITIPTYGQIFGHEGRGYSNLEPDEDEQFELMKQPENRVSVYHGRLFDWWLRNADRERFDPLRFACVDHSGRPDCEEASLPLGIRPLLILPVEQALTSKFNSKKRKKERL